MRIQGRGFDPLVDFDGLWTVELAARYLPISGVPLAKHEAWDGKLSITAMGGVPISYASAKLGSSLSAGACKVGYRVCGQTILVMGTPDRWIQPDVTIIDGPLDDRWVAV